MSGRLVISLKDELDFIKSILIPAFDPDVTVGDSKERKEWMRQEASTTLWGEPIARELIKRYGAVKDRDEAIQKETNVQRLLECEYEEKRLAKGNLPDNVRFSLQGMVPSSALEEYVETGNILKDPRSISGVSTIEQGLDRFVDAVEEAGKNKQAAVFSYLDGSSGLGKTQLAFALKRSVLYIPLGTTQAIYECFESLRNVMLLAVGADLIALRDDSLRRLVPKESLFTAGHIRLALGLDRQPLKYCTARVLLKLLELFAVSRTQAQPTTNVFLGVDHEEVLEAMTVDEGLRAAETYRDILIFLDEIPVYDSEDKSAFQECMFLRNLCRCLALPCLLSGTESTLLDFINTASGSRYEGSTPWARLLITLPANRLDMLGDAFGDYERHLLSCARPLFAQWFAGATEGDAQGCKHMTPATLSVMKHKICMAKLKRLAFARVNDDRDWLHASTMLVFADSLEEIGEVGTTVHAGSAAQVGKKRPASAAGPLQVRKKQKVSGLGSNVHYHSLLIRKHFALLHVPAEVVDADGMVSLCLKSGGVYYPDITPYEDKSFIPKATFKSCAEDPLLYLTCLRGGLMGRPLNASPEEFVQVPSSYAFTTFRVQSDVGNTNAKSNNGVRLEAECMAAMVLAAHRYTAFTGTPFFDWLAHVIAELSPERAYKVTEITVIPEELRAALQDLLVPLLSPPNCPWGEESMRSGVNFANLSWCKNQEKRDASAVLPVAASSALSADEEDTAEFPLQQVEGKRAHAYTTLAAEMKDRTTFGGDDMVAVTTKVPDNGVCVLFGSDLANWQKGTIQKFAPDVAVYRMNARGVIKRVPDVVPTAGWLPGRKVLIALDLEKLHPGRYAALPHAT